MKKLRTGINAVIVQHGLVEDTGQGLDLVVFFKVEVRHVLGQAIEVNLFDSHVIFNFEGRFATSVVRYEHVLRRRERVKIFGNILLALAYW
jgi:hypothetical protein